MYINREVRAQFEPFKHKILRLLDLIRDEKQVR